MRSRLICKPTGYCLLGLALLGSGLVTPASSRADEKAALGREIIAKWEKAVVTVKVVTKTRMIMEGRETGKHESTNEATGVIIEPSGLAVLSLSEADPSHFVGKMMGEGEEGFKMEVEVTDVKLRLADGKELRAKLVLRDKDLDLAFVRPAEAPEKPLLALDLTGEARPEVLDEIVLLNRLGEIANRVPAASLARIQAIINKPRTFYVPSDMQGLGCPAFTLDGKVLGLLVMRAMASPGDGGGGLFGGGGGPGMLPVILPAADVLEAAKQAPKE
jgi:hypothetical protein